jgi:hypothetical protein
VSVRVRPPAPTLAALLLAAACGSSSSSFSPPPDAEPPPPDATPCPQGWPDREPQTLVPAATAGFGISLVLDGPELYWTDYPLCSQDGCAARPILWRAPLAGGDAVATLTSSEQPGVLAGNASWVFLGVGDGVLRLSSDGTSPEPITGLSRPWFLAADDSWIYVGQGTQLFRARPDGSSAVVLANVKDAWSAVLYQGAIYWLEDHSVRTDFKGAIWVVPAAGGVPVRLLDFTGEALYGLMVGDAGIFFATWFADTAHGSIWRLGDDGEPQRLIDHQHTAGSIASGKDFIYWEDGAAYLHRLRADGACLESRDPGIDTPLVPTPEGLLLFDPSGLVLLPD